jgi:hypothetical protein
MVASATPAIFSAPPAVLLTGFSRIVCAYQVEQPLGNGKK